MFVDPPGRPEERRRTTGNGDATAEGEPMKSELDTFYALVDEIKVAMMTTRRPDGHLESRAMANQKRADGADLWFVTVEVTCVAARYRTRSPRKPRVLQAGLVRMGICVGYGERVAGPQQDPRALRVRLESVVRAGRGSASWHGGQSSDRPLRHRRSRCCVSPSQQTEAGCAVRTGEGLADGGTSGGGRNAQTETATSLAMAERLGADQPPGNLPSCVPLKWQGFERQDSSRALKPL